ncbi:hypothetical protein EN858_22135 [Mesorhizobium sp. M4B.F.Ca.ET.215.01.1.1]|uniref:hypothetical protein n=2 Tax=unclassified Mesorhizobium TaxID=325217 RepID=UPI000FC9FF75|nr:MULTISPECIES: hypothetical protein [unclassified Mesorhizobium]RUW26566.1 hypothetical protein EOA34_07910 [Mesorhizobium sp. M4B.F.Ca.ET.013.02.1.1]TGQ08433.1 hypothetical protein EN858_22135 [Mesorhizobium sp. M4B.F.Ca.ET.215.01.1.1]RVD45786.1 hypothetical protein EN741_04000 [Mesorhizobium sp. M4B.F.Ca.ET.019.03.1.1]TGQ40990.1 hypothetical protein EN863_021470 [Mesorhizobium sp. M00.F.Ca.ET.220.01.1.1]TGR01989.1 hypothetical protein EN846_18995 [Mesorhizobium sp. M4B.F.Ca.ET.203.01.1.1]
MNHAGRDLEQTQTASGVAPRRALLQMSSTSAIIFAIGFLAFAASAPGAELQRSCIEPPATVIELTGVNTKHARAKAKFSEPDIVKACHEGYVAQGTFSSPEKCIRETKVTLLGDEISAVANCSKGTLRLGEMTFKMPVDENCASGGIFAAPAFTVLCPKYRGRIVNP